MNARSVPGLMGVPLVGLGGGDGEARIEVDQLGFALHHPADEVHGVGGDDALEAIGAGHDHVLAVEQVEARHGAKGGAVGQVHRGQAEGGVADQVGRAEGQTQVLEKDFLEPLGGGPEGGLGAVLRLYRGELLGREVEGLVPGRLLPLPFTSGAYPDQGVLDAVGVVDLLDGRIAAGAEHVPGLRIFGIGIQLADDAPLHHGDGRALVGAELAGGGHLAVIVGDRPALPEVLEAAHLGGGGHTGGDAGGLQEQAAIHAKGSHGVLPGDTGMQNRAGETFPGPDVQDARTSLPARRRSTSRWRGRRTAAWGSSPGRSSPWPSGRCASR